MKLADKINTLQTKSKVYEKILLRIQNRCLPEIASTDPELRNLIFGLTQEAFSIIPQEDNDEEE